MRKTIAVVTHMYIPADEGKETLDVRCFDCDWGLTDLMAHEDNYIKGEEHVLEHGHLVVIVEHKD